MIFANTLRSLAEKQTSTKGDARDDLYLEVYEQRRFLRLLPIRKYRGRLYLRLVHDEWRVMFSDAKTLEGTFYGADYSATDGEDSATALHSAWIRESNAWRRCIGAEIDLIDQRISTAIQAAQTSTFGEKRREKGDGSH